MHSGPHIQPTFPCILPRGTFSSCKARILDLVKLDLPQGKKACHCGSSPGISKMSCGQALVAPVTQQQGLARLQYHRSAFQ